MRLFVIRHGESENNKQKLWTGWVDSDLTERGIEDAREAGKLLNKFSFDKVYSSDLKRAIQTAQAAIVGCTPETSSLLREFDVGSLANQPLDVITPKQNLEIADNGYSCFGGESNAEFKSRVLEFTKKIEVSGYQNIAVFTHAGWARAFLKTVIGDDVTKSSICCQNCATGVFEFENRQWKLHSWINLFK